MPPPEPNAITHLLGEVSNGNQAAHAQLLELVYGTLRAMARQHLAKGSSGQTLQATALVHEAWMRMGAGTDQGWESRAHFFATAARAMRDIIVDQARRKRRLKRGGGHERIELTTSLIASPSRPEIDVLELNEALTKFEESYARPARIAMLRIFAGASIDEIVRMLDVSRRTVGREWSFARSWLARELGLVGGPTD
ncbi:MAG: sigma-70 family RNA polymerase sigma factor [Planctomycetes bacterium]|nr:sigma-70 family RNA polymerase sigma factor [Planctomycetota bacterium]